MAYKDIAERKAASKRHYEKNKQKYLERNTKYRAEIQNFIRNMKEANPCVDCGISYPYYVMDFDHVGDAPKIKDINFLASTGRVGALKKEVVKCEVVCANCHRKRTHSRMQQANKRP